MQRTGVPRSAINSMFTTIQKLKHHVRTSFGDSTTFFGGSNQHPPPQGVGQGNGAGPAIWAVLSSPMFDIQRKKGFGAKFTAPISGSKVHLAGFGFVDDTDLIQTDHETIALIPKIQQALNT